jgi:DNA-binding XRE family transcriptional regulator
MNLAQRLAERLRQLRQQEGISQVQMARRLGIGRSTLNRLEMGSQNARHVVPRATLRHRRAVCGGDSEEIRQQPTPVRLATTSRCPKAINHDLGAPTSTTAV